MVPISKMAEGNLNVLFYVPNLIGYGRVIFAFVSCYFMPFDPYKALFFYILSSGMDAIDGYAARAFNQSSRFGAVLDMVTDRFTTTLLLVMLSVLYKDYIILFQFLIAVDIVSHWFQMYSSLITSQQSHKSDKNFNALLKWYYSKVVLFLMCSGNEICFAMLYIVHFTGGPELPLLFGWSVGIWWLILLVCCPVALLKNFINIVQLIEAAKVIIATEGQKEKREN